MPVIEIRHIRTGRGRDQERTEIAGAIQVTARVGSYPAGSFQLRHIDGIVFSQAGLTKRTVMGSVRDPQTTYANTVLLRGIFTGSTGTRAVTGIAASGSTVGAGTLATAYFHAWGH